MSHTALMTLAINDTTNITGPYAANISTTTRRRRLRRKDTLSDWGLGFHVAIGSTRLPQAFRLLGSAMVVADVRLAASPFDGPNVSDAIHLSVD
jgi:hypothetical protein